jgi:hypothetical protein
MYSIVVPQQIEVKVLGGRLDTSLVVDPPLDTVQSHAKALGLNLQVRKNSNNSLSISANDLTYETELDTPFGFMSVRDAIGHPEFEATRKMRCQTPFRDSDSQAAFLSLGKDGRPFVHDSGTSTTHWIADAQPTAKATAVGSSVSQQNDVDGELLFDVNAFRAARFVDKPPQAQVWLLRDLLPAGIVALLVAPGGTGKSWFVMQVAAGVATGMPIAGIWEVGTSGSVLMLCAEDDESQLHRRFAALLEHLTQRAASELISCLSEKLVIVPLVGHDNLITATHADSREVKSTPLLDKVIATAKQISDLKLIIIDPASQFRGGDENSAEDTTRFVQALQKIAVNCGATVLVVHHTNKGAFQDTEHNQTASRGSSALSDGVRWQMNLMPFSEKMASKFKIPVGERKSFLTAEVTKSNYAAPAPAQILKRHTGGYLYRADLVPDKTIQADSLNSRILELVDTEARAGRCYSKTGFATKFGGTKQRLAIGNNALRDGLTELLSKGQLSLNGNKLALRAKARIVVPEQQAT